VPDSGITIAKPEAAQNSVTEKRVAGKVTEVQVQSGKSHYVVKPNAEVGNAVKGSIDAQSSRPAQWTLLEFGAKKEVKEAAENSAANSAAGTETRK